MSSELRDEVIENLVDVYQTDGNAFMGASSLNTFAEDGIDVMVDSDEIPSSMVAAGSKTFLSGMLFGANTTLKMMTDVEGPIDHDEIVEANSPGIEHSLSVGLNQIKADILQKHVDNSEK